jgi:hypothetical protein
MVQIKPVVDTVAQPVAKVIKVTKEYRPNQKIELIARMAKNDEIFEASGLAKAKLSHIFLYIAVIKSMPGNQISIFVFLTIIIRIRMLLYTWFTPHLWEDQSRIYNCKVEL